MKETKTTQTITWGVLITENGNQQLIPCETKQEAETLASKYQNSVPLFGGTVNAILVKRLKTVTITYSDWKPA